MENPKTQDVERLNYSEPPPGYKVGQESEAQWYWVRGPVDGEGYRGDVAIGEGAALAAAWTHVKVHHDPPGVYRCGPLALYVTFGPGLPRFLSRTEAWAWYDCRLGLAEKWQRIYDTDGDARQLAAVRYRGADDETAFDNWWPRCLAWSSEQVANVERWLSDSTVETPGVLRV